MNFTDPNIADGTATVFTWLADKVLGGTKRALSWTWTQAQWLQAQDRYDEQIIKQYGEIRIFGQTTPKSLKDIFTDVYVLDKPTAFRRFSAEVLAEHMWNEDRGVSFRQGETKPGEQILSTDSKFFILGKPGAGKTTFLKRLAVRESQRGKWGKCLGKIPIFIALKQYADAGTPLLDFIVDQFDVCHFPDAAPFIEGLLKSGKALVLFDGLDEASTAEDVQANRRGRVTETIAEFSRIYSDCHIVVTCRIAATDYTFDSAFTYLEMSDFAPDQVDTFVRKWFWDQDDPELSAMLADQMLAELALPEHQGIRDLARSPLLLTMLCLSYAETLSFPARRVEIYEEALDALLKKWDSSRHIQRGGLYRTLSLGRKRQMFARIAYEALVRNEILFTQRDLESWLTSYLRHVPELPASIDIDAEAVLKEIIAQHGIFAVQAHRLYSFAHLTFQEYYTARHVTDSATTDVIKTVLLHVNDYKWREVYLLTASMLSDGNAFFREFENSLYRLIAQNPRVVTWLQWAATQAASSQAGYRLVATRAAYVFQTDLVRNSERARREIKTEGVDNSALSIVGSFLASMSLPLDPDLDRDRQIALAMHRSIVAGQPLHATIRKVRQSLLQLAQEQKRPALYKSISAIDMPSNNAPLSTWKHYVGLVKRISEAEGILSRYDQLIAETQALKQQAERQMILNESDLVSLADYATASMLFHSCLQLAYVPDRRAFEDRMFLPPPTPDAST